MSEYYRNLASLAFFFLSVSRFHSSCQVDSFQFSFLTLFVLNCLYLISWINFSRFTYSLALHRYCVVDFCCSSERESCELKLKLSQLISDLYVLAFDLEQTREDHVAVCSHECVCHHAIRLPFFVSFSVISYQKFKLKLLDIERMMRDISHKWWCPRLSTFSAKRIHVTQAAPDNGPKSLEIRFVINLQYRIQS